MFLYLDSTIEFDINVADRPWGIFRGSPLSRIRLLTSCFLSRLSRAEPKSLDTLDAIDPDMEQVSALRELGYLARIGLVT